MFSQLFSSSINIYSLKTSPTKQRTLGTEPARGRFGDLGFASVHILESCCIQSLSQLQNLRQPAKHIHISFYALFFQDINGSGLYIALMKDLNRIYLIGYENVLRLEIFIFLKALYGLQMYLLYIQ